MNICMPIESYSCSFLCNSIHATRLVASTNTNEFRLSLQFKKVKPFFVGFFVLVWFFGVFLLLLLLFQHVVLEVYAWCCLNHQFVSFDSCAAHHCMSKSCCLSIFLYTSTWIICDPDLSQINLLQNSYTISYEGIYFHFLWVSS